MSIESHPCRERIEEMLADDEAVPEYEFGAIIEVKVTEVAERGVFVEMHPALPPVLIHVSQLSATKVSTVHRTSNL